MIVLVEDAGVGIGKHRIDDADGHAVLTDGNFLALVGDCGSGGGVLGCVGSDSGELMRVGCGDSLQSFEEAVRHGE